jgi:hypothetical protein
MVVYLQQQHKAVYVSLWTHNLQIAAPFISASQLPTQFGTDCAHGVVVTAAAACICLKPVSHHEDSATGRSLLHCCIFLVLLQNWLAQPASADGTDSRYDTPSRSLQALSCDDIFWHTSRMTSACHVSLSTCKLSTRCMFR